MKRFGVLLRHYLLIALSLAFLTGIILQNACPSIPPPPVLLCSSLISLILLFGHRKTHRICIPALLLLAGLLGFLHAANSAKQSLHETTIASRITGEEDTVLIGTLHTMPLFDGKSSTITIKSHYLRLKDEKAFSQVKGLIQLRLKDTWPSSFLPGDELVIRARLSRPYRFGNPGGFNYPAFLDAKNIRTVGRISSPAHIHPLDHTQSLFHRIRYLPERMRLLLKQKIDNILPPQQAAMYRALLIGDRSGLNRAQLESFKASGVFHILAISGLHLSIVASVLFAIFYWLVRRSSFLMLRISSKKMALLATIPPLFCYALLAGFQTPVLRSLIMVVIFILSFCIHRQRSPFTTLSFAALVILLIHPATLFTVSFQLSFAAVASLILILPRLSSIMQRDTTAGNSDKKTNFFTVLFKWTSAATLVSVVATVGTAPLLIYSFNRLSTVGPIANLFIEPLLCLWTLPLGLLSLPLLFISPSLGEWLLHTGGTGITAAAVIADFLAAQEYSTLWFATPAPTLIILYYLALFLYFMKFFRKTSLLLLSIVCCLFFFPPQSFFAKYSKESELVFLDVGQGSSTFLSFPGGRRILIDGGGSSSEKFNVGESIIAPYLWNKGITTLDAVVITHPDSDHYNGIPFILNRFRPPVLWINGSDGHEQTYQELLTLAEELKIRVKKPEENQILLAAEGAVLENITSPLHTESENYATGNRISSNDDSLILKFTASNKKLSCLFPGDISSKVEKELVENVEGNRLQSSFLLSPHHGSKTSNSQLFLKNVNPWHIVVSAGSFRPLLFPSPQLRRYCKENDIQLLNTAETGALTIRTDGANTTIHRFISDAN
ncbi:DNA internalization-related competence protein ComEC/Rec2 [Desulfocapsa sulfexigens DSM 10523]|uniref:DNA internalization-related competence protein ComEC/Rec2 n=1 Tax=Desulfocapsa sulfexigens (strain DSM 10523 / SB164P1) TaxID=1167006 RepID=M1NJS6_DESSD|nr:DNA internalization-related competence protein ComEC/Rec2 [Desulfocapsa sulfexigens]AGF79834.1 DNA internalization-related competence protein ComEC/Rec2 [Desulfocapsa sulfexigens DSM 10523]